MKKDSSKKMLFEAMHKVAGMPLNENWDETKFDQLYQTKILPNLERIGEVVKKKIELGEISVNEEIPTNEYKLGAYAVGEPWHTLGQILVDFSQTLDNHRTIIDDGFGEADETLRDDYVNKLVNDLQNNKIIYLEW